MDSYAELSEALLGNHLERVDEVCRRHLVEVPGDAEMLTLSGALARRKGDLEGALECFVRAADLAPTVAQFRNNLGVVLEELGRHQEAVGYYRQALTLKPDYGEARCNLANALQAMGRTDEAIQQYRETLAHDPSHLDARYNLANALRRQGRLQEASECYRRVVATDPRRLCGWINLGATLHALGDVDQAIEAQRTALSLDPDSADAHWNLALSLLAAGDYRNGWREYQWRLGGERFPTAAAGKPMWDGAPLAGRTLLLRSEQGFGDTLQFYRYAALLAREGVRVLLECRPELLPLLSRQKHGIRCFAAGEEPPPFDTFAYLMSLPFLLGCTLSNLPARVPYLEPDPALSAHWEKALKGSASCRVGLAWAGSAGYSNDRSRSLPLHLLKPLAGIPGVRLYSLQIGGAAALDAEPWGRGVHDLSAALSDFAVTAAVIANLDLVVSVDTAVAHLAGALGKPVYLMLASPAEWRWLRERADSPWYPTMRLYRQERGGEWGEVIDAVVRDVRLQRRNVEPAFQEADRLRRNGRYTEAVSAYRELLALRPDCAEVHNNLGMAQQELGDLEEALRSYRRAIALDPESAHPFNNLGTVLASRGDHAAAQQCFTRAVEIESGCVAACLNLGSSLQGVKQPEQAVQLYRRVLELEPASVEARVRLGTVYRELMQPEQAIALFEEALDLDPQHSEAHVNLALTLLSVGDFGRGWRELEWRFAGSVTAVRGAPRWKGEALAGLGILLLCEQGAEDTLQFIRFATMVAARGATVVVQCQSPSLKPLLQRVPGVTSVCANGEPPPRFDLWAPLLSLPGIFGARLEWLPASPYLSPEPLKAAFWGTRIGAARELKVGLVWGGGESELAPLWGIPGIAWYLLELEEKPDPALLPLVDLSPQVRDLAEMSAVMANLDLVLTHDAAAAHLAGGMGVPVWTLLPYACDWRWLSGRDDSPWYPSMRLFRQERPGEWRGVVLRVGEALKQLIREREGG